MKRITNALIAAVFLITLSTAAEAYRFQPQENTAAAWTSEVGGNTDCTADETDYSPVTTATASLTCANTGEINIRGWQQMTVQLKTTRNASTAVVMQCDISNDGGTIFTPIMTENAAGEKTVRTWTETTSISARVTHNFDVNAWLIRCRFMMTGGNVNDKIGWLIRKSSNTLEK